MSTIRSLVGLMILMLAAVVALPGADDKDNRADAPKEQTEVDYASTTHGALLVKAVSPEPGDWFMLFQNGKQLVPPGKPRLNTTVELAPGDYIVRVNRTERKVNIKIGKKTVLLTGELVVEAKEGTPGWYTPYQGKEAKLASNPPVLNSSIALFAGKYTVVYSEGGVGKRRDLGEVEIAAGRKTTLKL